MPEPVNVRTIVTSFAGNYQPSGETQKSDGSEATPTPSLTHQALPLASPTTDYRLPTTLFHPQIKPLRAKGGNLPIHANSLFVIPAQGV
jgi:hypothetical protein